MYPFYPFGAIVSAYIRELIAGKKGQFVLSEHYQEVIRKTPHIQGRASIGTLCILLSVLLGPVVILFAIIAFIHL